jgi:uncharacterized delta-60 repeat protein
MKKTITILAALTVAYAFVCVAAYAFQNEPDGFEGITWGTNIAEVADKLVYLHTDPRYGGIQIYKIKRSWLQALRGYKVWGVKVKSIECGSWRGRFSEVTIKTEDAASFDRLKNLCFERFGPGHQEDKNRERYTWTGKITLMKLEYRDVSGVGILSMASTKDRQLQEAFAKQMTTGGGNWAKTYGGTGIEYASYIQQTADGGYIVTGATQSFGAGENDIWVLKLDANGAVQWQKTYGGPSYDNVTFSIPIQQTADGGYIVAGSTTSFGAGYGDIWVLKLNADGTIKWQKTYGGSSYDTAYSIQQTADGGYIVAGATSSFGAGNGDLWVLMLDANGAVQWQKTYGGTDYESAYSIQQTTDGGYIVAGANAFLIGGNGDFWVLKLDSSGTIAWQKTYGGTNSEFAFSIQQTADGGYIVTGATSSFGAGYNDIWVLKLDANGTIAWQKTYGGTKYEHARSIQQTADGGYIVAGSTTSFGAGENDIWVLKLDAEGNISDSCPFGIGQATAVFPTNTLVLPANSQSTISDTSCTVTSTSVTPQDTNAAVETQCSGSDITWAKTYGSINDDRARAIQQTSDGGYIVAGYINFPPEVADGAFGDFGVLKLDVSGAVEWQKTYGKVYFPSGASEILETIDKGYIVAVYASSFGGDIWVLKLDASGVTQWQKTYGGTGWDVPYAIQQTTDGGYILAGSTFSFGTNGDVWILKLQADGDIDWEKTYGGEAWDIASSIRQTADGGYIVAGATSSFGARSGDAWVLKLDASGAVQWQKTYGSTDYESAYSIQQTADGGYIVVGSIIYDEPPHSDIWILQLDMYGNIQWQKTYGGTNYEAAHSIQQTEDGGYIVGGYTASFGAGNDDVWVLKLDANGTITWQKTYGGSGLDQAMSIQQGTDGGYIVAGLTDSFGAGRNDVFVLKLDANGNISNSCPSGIGQATSVIPANTSIVPEATQAIVSDTSCTANSTSGTPQDSNIVVETPCND